VRRLWLIPTVRRLLAAWAVLGVVTTPLLTYMSFLLQDRWRMGLGQRSAFLGVAWALALPVLAWFAPRGDALFRADPARLVSACAAALGVLAVGLFLTAATPVAGLALVAFGVALASTAVLVPALTVTTLSLVRPRARSHAGALVAVFLVGVGGQGGAALLGGLDSRFGPGVAIALLAIPAMLAALLVRRAAGTVNGDLDQMLSELVEEEEVRALTQRGRRLPMLACRHIDFSYGQLQVLFDVNFTVDDGEIVALLGTNGAGKSTLLRVVSGLGFPSRGSTRLRGLDITYVDAERRVGMGISQVPGGRAVYGPLTVVENMRVLGYTHGRNRRAVEAGIDASFEAFPRLAERRNQQASTLSGGEQQMLGLATAFIVRPRLLLIDELSLGLAPKVVGELLEMVRRINADGAAVVLVEQSVNLALSVVEHAYFMEKGQIRFDGAAAALLARPDLLRSVFLEGASKSLQAARRVPST
jgi:ABC-type branched-subunit amino acid transport system ATPase component